MVIVCDSVSPFILGKAPQSALSKDQMGLLRDIADSELTLEEKNTLLRYLYFDSVIHIWKINNSQVAYSRCLESDFAKETKQKNDIKKENEKCMNESEFPDD